MVYQRMEWGTYFLTNLYVMTFSRLVLLGKPYRKKTDRYPVAAKYRGLSWQMFPSILG